MYLVSSADVDRMRDKLLFEGDDVGERLSRFWLLLILAAVIASTGVVADSTATVIGAMIVAPLMTPILGSVLSVVLADRANLLRCLGLVLLGAVAVVVVGWLVGSIVEQPVVAATNSQVAARVSPRLIDLLAALATGAVGAIAISRDDISDTLPGVAIAISLVPPLAVAGLAFEGGASDQAFGAILLFVTNVSAILAMGLLVMSIYRVGALVQRSDDAVAKPVSIRRAALVIGVALVVISVPLGLTSTKIARTRSSEAEVSSLATDWGERHGWSVVSVSTRPDGILVRATGPLPEPETASLKAALAAQGLGDDVITLELIPTTSVEVGAERSGD
ncbi:MAG: DUF389 domain-containing protein [Acidimicrobiales bacterium]